MPSDGCGFRKETVAGTRGKDPDPHLAPKGMSLLRGGLRAFGDTGAENWMTHHVALLGLTCEIAGQVDEGLALFDDALQMMERTGERWLEAEVNRHKGRLLLRQGRPESAEELYRKALKTAVE